MMTKDEVAIFAGERVGDVIDKAIQAGMSFDDAIEELRYHIQTAIENREEYEA